MSTQVPTWMTEAYKANVYHLTQQKGSVLKKAVRVESIAGAKSKFFDQIGSTTARLRTSRHSDTPRMDTPHARRRVTLADFDWADLVDSEDQIRMLAETVSPYADAGAMAMGRAMDETIIAAADGIAYTGVDGSTATAFDTAMVVTVQTRWPGIAASDLGLNLAKLLEARKLLGVNNVDPSEERWCIVNEEQVNSLLKDARISSFDYNNIKPLTEGNIGRAAGFNLISTQLIGIDANTDHKVLFWAKSGMLLGLGKDHTASIDKRPDKNNATQVLVQMSIGATRMEEVRVGYIACDPATGPGA